MRAMFTFVIRVYQKTISPIFKSIGIECKYYPTCSQYTQEAISKYGIFKGMLLGIKRIFRCNPWSKGGYDPLK